MLPPRHLGHRTPHHTQPHAHLSHLRNPMFIVFILCLVFPPSTLLSASCIAHRHTLFLLLALYAGGPEDCTSNCALSDASWSVFVPEFTLSRSIIALCRRPQSPLLFLVFKPLLSLSASPVSQFQLSRSSSSFMSTSTSTQVHSDSMYTCTDF